jgi:two-component system response regulator PilR (NtrC family)
MKKDNKIKILIVDDDKEIRNILSLFLAEDSELLIETAGTGEEAFLKHVDTPYDIVITDINMPGMTGIELIKKIKTRDDIVEFIIITGYASVDTAVEAVRIGAFDYVVKPFKFDELKIVINNAKDKVVLRKTNKELVKKLKDVYREIDRYSRIKIDNRSLDFSILLDE